MGLSKQIPEGVLGTGGRETTAIPARSQRRDLGRRADSPANQTGGDRVLKLVPAAVGGVDRVAEARSHRRALTVAYARGCFHGHKDRILDRDLSTGDAERFFEGNLQMGQDDPFDRTRRCHHVGLASRDAPDHGLSPDTFGGLKKASLRQKTGSGTGIVRAQVPPGEPVPARPAAFPSISHNPWDFSRLEPGEDCPVPIRLIHFLRLSLLSPCVLR